MGRMADPTAAGKKLFLVLRDVEYCRWLDVIHLENDTICLPNGTAVAVRTEVSLYLGEIYKYDGSSRPHLHWFGDLYSDGETYYLMPRGWEDD
jgi:hypothetical protein